MKKHINKINKISKEKFKNLDTSTLKIPALTLVLGLLLGYLVSNTGLLPNPSHISTNKTKDLIESYLLSSGIPDATISNVVAEGDLYKVSLNVAGYDYTSYATKDGSLLFPEGLDLQSSDSLVADTPTPQPTEVPTSDKPSVELFVMSHCPYGTQAMKGILPAQEALGDKIDFNIKFVNYAMHGEVEVYEQLNQYCIQKDFGRDTFANYLGCFLEAGDSEACLSQTGIDTNALSACTNAADTEFSITANFNDQSTWMGSYPPFNTHDQDNIAYGVQGSPTLVINGVQSNAGRDSVSYLNAICNAFNEQPEECNTQLSPAQPTPGFGYGSETTAAPSAAVAANTAQCL